LEDQRKVSTANFLTVLGRGTAPLFTLLSHRLSFVPQMLQALENLYKEPQPLLAIRPIRRIQNMIGTLKIQAMGIGDSVAAKKKRFGDRTFAVKRKRQEARGYLSEKNRSCPRIC
jgi:hypothetical protein